MLLMHLPQTMILSCLWQQHPVLVKANFVKTISQRIREFRRRYPSKNIHVDGGVNGEVSFILRNIGVDAAVSGSFLMGTDQKK
jgi:pentose-5-phosphate-3-epimerase